MGKRWKKCTHLLSAWCFFFYHWKINNVHIVWHKDVHTSNTKTLQSNREKHRNSWTLMTNTQKIMQSKNKYDAWKKKFRLLTKIAQNLTTFSVLHHSKSEWSTIWEREKTVLKERACMYIRKKIRIFEIGMEDYFELSVFDNATLVVQAHGRGESLSQNKIWGKHSRLFWDMVLKCDTCKWQIRI